MKEQINQNGIITSINSSQQFIIVIRDNKEIQLKVGDQLKANDVIKSQEGSIEIEFNNNENLNIDLQNELPSDGVLFIDFIKSSTLNEDNEKEKEKNDTDDKDKEKSIEFAQYHADIDAFRGFDQINQENIDYSNNTKNFSNNEISDDYEKAIEASTEISLSKNNYADTTISAKDDFVTAKEDQLNVLFGTN